MTNATDASATEAIEAFVPETREVTIAGKPKTVRRLETRQIWPILRCGLPIIEGLAALVPASSPAADSPLGSSTPARPTLGDLPGLKSLLGSDVTTFVSVMAEHGERVTEIIACALDITVREAGQAEPQEAYLAMKAIVEVNRDFFTHRVLPLLGTDGLLSGAFDNARAAMQGQPSIGDGGTPSSS